MRKAMVVGFLFDDAGQRVALIRKQHPEWQQGLLNGIGGKTEEGESPLQAIVREFQEETGALVFEWRHFATMLGDSWIVECFEARSRELLEAVRTTTDEEVCIVELDKLREERRMRNLDLLVSLALDESELTSAPILTY